MMNLRDLQPQKGMPLVPFRRNQKLIGRINTPLKVSHSLVMEVWFSIDGEDEWGNPCEEYKTRVRTLTLKKTVMIPSVRVFQLES